MPESIRFDGSMAGLSSLVAVFLVLVTVTLALRFVARYKQKVKPGIDDYLAIVPWLCFGVFFALAIYGMAKEFKGKLANPDKTLRPKPWETEKVDWSSDIVSVVALGSIRLSAVFFYRRIFCTGRRDLFDVASKMMIFIITIWTIGFFIESLIVCDGSVSAIFQAAPSCAFKSWLYGLAFSSLVLDLLVILLPVPMIWSLHTTMGRKLSISAVFLLAGCGLGASAARATILVFIWTNNTSALNTHDVNVANTISCYYQYLEVGVGAIAVNLPSLWYFRNDVKPGKLLRSMRSLVSLRSSASKTPNHENNGTFMDDNHDYSMASFFSHKEVIPSARDKLEINASSTTHAISKD